MTGRLQLHIPIERRVTTDKGTSLFTTQAIAAGALILTDDRPLITTLDTAKLGDHCEWCLASGDETYDEPEERPLRFCKGCKIVKYCSKTCQTSSWRHAHKFICPIYRRYYPKILPTTARAILEILIRRSKGLLLDAEWEDLKALQSHADDFKQQQEIKPEEMTTWQTVEIMSQAVKTYSGTNEPISFIQDINAMILTNTHTLTTPVFDSLGFSLSLTASRISHSCAPNSCITFSGPKLSLRSLGPIPANAELTITYIDLEPPTPWRQSKLKSQYFFTCACDKCTTSVPSSETQFPQDIVDETNQLLGAAQRSDPVHAYSLLSRAIAMLESVNPKPPLHAYPSPSVRHQMMLTAIEMRKWGLGLKMALQHRDIDTKLYPQKCHPLRVVHAWVLLCLLLEVAVPGTFELGQGEKAMDWHLVIWYLWEDVMAEVPKSHGIENRLYRGVIGFGNGLKDSLENFKNDQGAEKAARLMQREWVRLKALVDHL